MSNRSTREKIVFTIEAMFKAGNIMTISGVARETGVSNSTIHNRYPDLAEHIRDLAGKANQINAKTELGKRRGKIKELTMKLSLLREDIAELKEQLRQADSANASLLLENESLQTRHKIIQDKFSELLREGAETRKINQDYLIVINRLLSAPRN